MSIFLHRAGATLALLVTLLSATLASAHTGLVLHDPYARMTPQSGAVYVFIQNHADDADALIAASSPQADMAMVMSVTEKDGVSSMQDAPQGLPIPAYDTLLLAPGKAHVMLMGLKGKYRDGDTIEVTLTFEHSGSVTLTVPVANTRSDAPGDVKTAYNGETNVHHDEAISADTGKMSTPATGNQNDIIALMKAQFDKPDAPLTVDPVVVMGDDAIASWAQGDMAGRALLRRTDGAWAIVLCAGPDLRTEDFLAQHGVSDATMLSQMFNQAEDGLGADKVSLFSTFQGVSDMSKPASN